MKLTQILTTITLVSLPLYIVRCKDFTWCTSPIPITLLEVLILATFSAWLIWRVYGVKNGKIKLPELFDRLRGPFFWPLVVFLVVATISMFISPDIRSAAGAWKAYFIEPALLYLVILDLSLEKKSISWVIYSLIFSGIWLSLLALWQARTGVNPFAPESMILGRVTAVYNTPNALALYLSPIFLITIGLLLDKIQNKQFSLKNWFPILFLLASATIFLTTIFLTKSRGAGIGLEVSFLFFIGVIIYRFVPKVLKKALRYLFYGFVLTTSLLVIFSFVNVERFFPSEREGFDRSGYTRLCIWQGTRDLISERPILGSGLSGFPQVYPKYATCEPFHFQYPHNIFFNFWVELGAIGLLVFLWATYNYWRVLTKHLDKLLAASLLATIVYIFIHGLVDVPYFKNDLSSQFWAILAIVSWFGSNQSESD